MVSTESPPCPMGPVPSVGGEVLPKYHAYRRWVRYGTLGKSTPRARWRLCNTVIALAFHLDVVSASGKQDCGGLWMAVSWAKIGWVAYSDLNILTAKLVRVNPLALSCLHRRIRRQFGHLLEKLPRTFNGDHPESRYTACNMGPYSHIVRFFHGLVLHFGT